MVDNVNTGVALLLLGYSAIGAASQTPGLKAEVLEPQDPKTFCCAQGKQAAQVSLESATLTTITG